VADVQGLLDLNSFYRASAPRSSPVSLAGLVAECMEGAILNKDACLSNWEARPLSKKQLKYAALDAAVLLPLFLELHHSVPVSYSDLVSSFSAPGRSRKRNEETTTATAVESGGQKQLKK